MTIKLEKTVKTNFLLNHGGTNCHGVPLGLVNYMVHNVEATIPDPVDDYGRRCGRAYHYCLGMADMVRILWDGLKVNAHGRTATITIHAGY